jgi:type IV pilus assembly protein PilA
MIVVAIVGVLAALAIYGVRKYVLNAKTAEARNAIGQMAKDASTSYNREAMDGTVLALGAESEVSNALCGKAADTVPTGGTPPEGKKFQSSPADWQDVDQNTGWACLKFSMQDPQYYLYQYDAANTAAEGGTFAAIAQGDLDGDGEASTFTLNGEIKSDSTTNTLVVVTSPNIIEDQPDE